MTRETLIRKLRALSEEEYASVAPYIEADLESIEVLKDLRGEVAAGRRDAKARAPLSAADVYRRVRRALAK